MQVESWIWKQYFEMFLSFHYILYRSRYLLRTRLLDRSIDSVKILLADWNLDTGNHRNTGPLSIFFHIVTDNVHPLYKSYLVFINLYSVRLVDRLHLSFLDTFWLLFVGFGKDCLRRLKPTPDEFNWPSYMLIISVFFLCCVLTNTDSFGGIILDFFIVQDRVGDCLLLLREYPLFPIKEPN